MAHPYDKQAKTGQQRADARYDQTVKKVPDPVYMADARKVEMPEETWTTSPGRQISNMGKVRN